VCVYIYLFILTVQIMQNAVDIPYVPYLFVGLKPLDCWDCGFESRRGHGFSCFCKAFSQNFEKRLLPSSCLSVRPSARNKLVPNGRIFTTLYVWVFFETPWTKCKSNSNPTKITDTLLEDLYTYDDISLSTSYNEKCVRKKCRENQNTFYSQCFFSPRKSCLV
jgi:hypothetical protein